jgi:general secretion pathway protein K
MRPPKRDRDRGIALAIVLVLIVLLITAVYAFSRRAVINVTVTQNRLAAAQADALARGGLRMAEAIVYLARLKELAGDAGGLAGDSSVSGGLAQGPDLWSQLGDSPIEFEDGQSLRITIEETSGRLNLNALVPQTPEDPDRDQDRSRTNSEDEEALEYLVLVLRHIIDGIDASARGKNYDARSLAQNLIDYMDADDTALNGRSEDDYYRRQDPPYQPRNGPLLSFEEIGLVEGVDPLLLEAMRDYLTVHPIGGRAGIDLNRAAPWVLPLVYSGPSGNRELLRERTVRRILALRMQGKIVCTDASTDPESCVTPSEAEIEGSIYPETPLPAPVAVFRVVAEARVKNLTRRMEAIYDTRPPGGPQLLSWRRLRGTD